MELIWTKRKCSFLSFYHRHPFGLLAFSLEFKPENCTIDSMFVTYALECNWENFRVSRHNFRQFHSSLFHFHFWFTLKFVPWQFFVQFHLFWNEIASRIVVGHDVCSHLSYFMSSAPLVLRTMIWWISFTSVSHSMRFFIVTFFRCCFATDVINFFVFQRTSPTNEITI